MRPWNPDGRTRVGAARGLARREHDRRPSPPITQILIAAALMLAAAHASARSIIVPATSNIFGAGHALPPDPGSFGPGTLPPFIPLPAVPDRAISFDSVTGLVSPKVSLNWWNGPDGGPYATGDTDILSHGGISGIIHDHATMFLVGVFTDETVPVDPAPPRLNVTTTHADDEFWPLLFQTFFIGDGLTGTGSGSTQVFHVPAAATRLYLGFADAYGFGDPTDSPGSYNDNAGEVAVLYTVVPSPGAAALLAGAGIVLLARRKKRS